VRGAGENADVATGAAHSEPLNERTKVAFFARRETFSSLDIARLSDLR
jgi:hypothetical protein